MHNTDSGVSNQKRVSLDRSWVQSRISGKRAREGSRVEGTASHPRLTRRESWACCLATLLFAASSELALKCRT